MKITWQSRYQTLRRFLFQIRTLSKKMAATCHMILFALRAVNFPDLLLYETFNAHSCLCRETSSLCPSIIVTHLLSALIHLFEPSLKRNSSETEISLLRERLNSCQLIYLLLLSSFFWKWLPPSPRPVLSSDCVLCSLHIFVIGFECMSK